jgi:two-component system cell cycle sensor histidine kinase/response regulator CckA
VGPVPTSDARPLRILILEDNPDDAEMLVRELRRAAVVSVPERADTEADFLARLDPPPDLILADYHLPGYGALGALRALRSRGVEVPVVVVSGTIGEEAAAECLREGATDYLRKDRLGRLGQAVRNALEQERLRQEERRMTAELRASEERYRLLFDQYRLLFDQAPYPMWVVDGETLRFLEVNHKAIDSYGYSRDEFLAMSMLEIRPPEEVPATLAGVSGALAGVPMTGRHRHRTKAGELLEVAVSSRPLSFAGRRALLAVIDDLTERDRLETQHRQAQKMEAVGQLAGGVAHDFNNLLTAILGYSELVGQQLADRPELREQVAEISRAGERGADLTRQLLAFSRMQALRPRLVDLNAVVAGVETMLGRLIGEDIELVTVLQPGVSPVLVDPGQIEQVIVNLVVNARDAMEDGGRLLVETADVELDAAYAGANAGATAGAHVRLAVSDTGCGMDAATRARIFEPFFTTKEAGRGTGLGLATVYGIVHQSGGRIEVYSEPGHGTSFKIYFPAAHRAAAGETPAAAATAAGAAPPPPLGSETLLVIEDDPALRRLTRILLEGGGYTVLAAASPAGALAFARESAVPIGLVLTDVVMPEMSGPEVAARLAVLLPEARVLYMSGYSGEVIGRRGLVPPGAALLEKPFTAGNLLRTVRQVLDQAGRDEPC